MTNHLIRAGFDMRRCSMNYHNPSYCIFEFFDTPALRQAMSQYRRQGA